MALMFASTLGRKEMIVEASSATQLVKLVMVEGNTFVVVVMHKIVLAFVVVVMHKIVLAFVVVAMHKIVLAFVVVAIVAAAPDNYNTALA